MGLGPERGNLAVLKIEMGNPPVLTSENRSEIHRLPVQNSQIFVEKLHGYLSRPSAILAVITTMNL